MKNILFFYVELSGYFVSSVLSAIENTPDIIIHIVARPNNCEAPFEFSKIHDRIKVYDRNHYNYTLLCDLIEKISPVSIIVSGWDDKVYLRSAKKHKNIIPLTLLMDNMWYGEFRQYLGSIYTRLFLVKLFNYIWVPGMPQKKLAKKFGFKESQILLNFYCADINRFQNYYNNSVEIKKNKFPHRFLYVGRYVPQKGIDNLWDAFAKLQEECPNDWELVCVGTGPLFESRMILDKIIHKGFIQPEGFQQIISETGVFVLPSWEEHWGVVLHEYASIGYPLICSKEVGAASAFLKDRINGFFFQAKNVDSLKARMLNIVNTRDSELLKMGKESISLSKEVNHKKWNESFIMTQKLN